MKTAFKNKCTTVLKNIKKPLCKIYDVIFLGGRFVIRALCGKYGGKNEAIVFFAEKLKERYSEVKILGKDTGNAPLYALAYNFTPAQATKKVPLTLGNPSHISGTGLYIRQDYWTKIRSGGSYGHTCYVAKEFAARSDNFIVAMTNKFDLIDEFGICQTHLAVNTESSAELNCLNIALEVYDQYRILIESVRPSFIYERICFGNHLSAILAKEYNIPLIVEYNGSEISMRRSFNEIDKIPYEAELLESEKYMFEQAVAISVVSEHVKNDLINRGVSEQKVLVNPNAVDTDAYYPASLDEKQALKQECGIPKDAIVMGFIGTFGGWHGIDVLAQALPLIQEACPEVHFLLIGDGNFRHLVDASIAKHALEKTVHMMGNTAQQEAARLLRACDIYVSPHSAHMVDMPFFGSPTKLFEYMGLGGAIVASDLEQIGQVLQPAMGPYDASKDNARALLCTPGNVQEFTDAVIRLVQDADLRKLLGKNAHEAAHKEYTWSAHVEKLLHFIHAQENKKQMQ